jgi:hypothetical protein
MTVIPTTIEFLKPEMTRLLKALRMDLKAYKSDYQAPKYDHSYDTNSYLIGIDNHASASMTNTENDFIGSTKTINVKIKGIKGYLNTTKVGTVRWRIQDDEGKSYRFDIPGTFLFPDY